MTSRERVLAALNFQATDRPPVGFWFHFPEDKARGAACVQAHLDYYNTVDVDLVKMMCDGYFDYPNPVAKAARRPEDWLEMKPLGPDSPFIREQVERAKAVKAGLKDEKFLLYNVFAPFSSIRFAAGDDLVMEHLRQNPEAILRALDVIAQDNATLCELLIQEAGLDGVYYCVQGGERDRFSAEDYRRLIGPSDRMVLERANAAGGKNILHCCGWAGIQNHLEVWKDYPAAAVNWAVFIEEVDLAAGRALFGNKCVLGGFDNRKGGVLYTGDREQIRQATLALKPQLALGGIAGADCTLPGDINLDHIRWVVEAMGE